jgi:hypothetical protein
VSTWVAAVISSFPGGCRFVVGAGVAGVVGVKAGPGVTSLDSTLSSLGVFFCGVVSVADVFFLLPLVLTGSLLATSGMDFFSSSFSCCLFCTEVTGVFATLVLLGVFVGVSGCGFAAAVAAGVSSTDCLSFLALEGVDARIGVTGITGTTGVMVDDAVRDIGRETG